MYSVPVLASHFAVNPVPPSGIIEGNSGSHHINVYPDNFGLAGADIYCWYFPVIGSTALHPLVLNVTLYTSLSYFTSTTVVPFPLIPVLLNTHALNPEYVLAVTLVCVSVIPVNVSDSNEV